MKINLYPEEGKITKSGAQSISSYGVSEKALGLLVSMAYKYTKPIESIVREITSNCVDSHREAKLIPTLSDEELIVKNYDPDKLEYFRNKFKTWTEKPIELEISRVGDFSELEIIFRDFGVGLNPARVDSIYTKFFESTKRLNDTEIGGFGLGSKSPFSYSDIFYVKTIFEGIEYTYVVSAGDPFGDCRKIFEQHTDEQNGTEIRIPIKSEGDVSNFIKAAKIQLCYFDNISYINFNFDRLAPIFFAENFVYRPGSPFESVHLCLDRCYYPIDFTSAPIGYNSCPIGLRIGVADLEEGDLDPLRESLKYTENVVKLITDKIRLAKEELYDLGNEALIKTDDLQVYYQLKDYFSGYDALPIEVKSNNSTYTHERDGKFFIDVPRGRVFANISSVDPTYTKTKLRLPSVSFIASYALNVWRSVDVDNRVYKPKNISLYSKIDAIFARGESVDTMYLTVDPGSPQKREFRERNQYILDTTLFTTIGNGFTIFKINTSFFKGNTTVVYPSETKEEDKDIKTIPVDRTLLDVFGFSSYRTSKNFPTQDDIIGINLFLSDVKKILLNSCHIYDKIQPPTDWVENYREEQKKLRNQKKEKISNITPVREVVYREGKDGASIGLGSVYPTFKMENVSNDYLNRKKLIIYGFSEHSDLLFEVANILFHNATFKMSKDYEKYGKNYSDTREVPLRDVCVYGNSTAYSFNFKVFKIAVNRKSVFEELPNGYFIEDIVKGSIRKIKTFRSLPKELYMSQIMKFTSTITRYVTAAKMVRSLEEQNIDLDKLTNRNVELVDKELYDLANFISLYIKTYFIGLRHFSFKDNYATYKGNSSFTIDKLEGELFHLFEQHKLYDKDSARTFKKFTNYVKFLPLLPHLDFDNVDLDAVKGYIDAMKGGKEINFDLVEKKESRLTYLRNKYHGRTKECVLNGES